MDLLLPSSSTLETCLSRLSAALSLEVDAPHPFSRIYLDSFDWRLYQCGLQLMFEETGGARTAVLVDQDDWLQVPVEALPRLARDLPETAWRSRVGEILDIRVLLPQAKLRGEFRDLRPANPKSQPAWHLRMETYASDPALPARLRLMSGQDKPARRILARLTDEFDFDPAESSLLDEILRLRGRTPQDPGALHLENPEPELPAEVAAKRILLRLLTILEINRPGVLAEWDTEFLHDFRVAVRRSRSALGQLKRVFPAILEERHARWLCELGRITGEARDLDVYLLHFPDLEASLPETMRADLAPLQTFLARRAREAHRNLNQSLKTRDFQRRLASWRRFLETAPPKQPKAENARLPIGELAQLRIGKLYRRLLGHGRAITEQSPALQIHELRKTAKKLRYLLEFFRGFYPADKILPFIKNLKTLQEYLGEFQDTHVQMERLRGFGEALRVDGTPTASLLAIGALLDRLYTREQELRGEFPQRFGRFREECKRLRVRHWL